MYESLSITGGDKLEALLTKLPADVERAILKDAVRAGAEPIHAAAQEKCPVSGDDIDPHKGELRESIKLRVTAAKGAVRATVGSREGDFKGETFYGPMVEYGHAQGQAKGGGPVHIQLAGQWVTLTPGTRVPPHPFLRPAFDENKEKATKIVGDEVARGIEQAAK